MITLTRFFIKLTTNHVIHSKRMYSTFDTSLLDDLIHGPLPVVEKKGREEKVIINLYWDMSKEAFNTNKDLITIANSLSKVVSNVDNNKRYQVHLYLLVSGKKLNVLPMESKKVLQKLMDDINNLDMMRYKYSILKGCKRNYINMQKNLQRILTSVEFSPYQVNDTRQVKNIVQKAVNIMLKNEPFVSLPVNIYIIAKRIKDVELGKDDHFINTNETQLRTNIEYARSTDLKPINKKKTRITSNLIKPQ